MKTASTERRAIISLSAIMSFRMLGLFMILPVFTLEAHTLSGATFQLIGLALGIYGFTQGCLQIPFGMLSDRFGRKPIIIAGLLLFIFGSIIAALSTNIYLLILGRACQGAGAVGSATLALLADLTRDENRSKAMAVVGLAIGSSFSLAMIFGPLINSWFHLAGIFWFTALLGLIGLLLLFIVPTPPKILIQQEDKNQTNQIKSVIKNTQLLRLNLGIFTLHATLTAVFIIIPILLSKTLQLGEIKQIFFYLIILITAFLMMVPLLIFAEKKKQLKMAFLIAVATLLLTQLFFLWPMHNAIGIGILLLLFFTAFTFLEATLPSWITKITPIRSKGMAMGIYSSSQFLGIFCGGAMGGIIYSHFAIPGVFIFTSMLLFIWLAFASGLKDPPYLSTLILQLQQFIEQQPLKLSKELDQIAAIAEVAIMPEEGLVYLKINQQILSKDELPKLLERSNLIRQIDPALI